MAGIFIVGCQRSGTTALYKALSAHPKLRQQSDRDGRPEGAMKELWFFHEFFRGREANPHRPHFPSELDTEFQERFARLVDEFCTERYAMGSKRWISARPDDALYIDKIMPLFPENEIRVLYLVRHPQEVVWSSLHAPWADKTRSTRKLLVEAARAAKYWNRFGPNAVSARDGKLGDAVKLIWHKDLLTDPEGTVRTMLEHIGEPFDERVVLEIQRTTNSSFKERTATSDKLFQRAAEISKHKLFCGMVSSCAAPYMQELGFADYGEMGRYGKIYKMFGYLT